MKKKVIYQIFTRLFGNKNTSNKPWGTLQENGVGKMDDITDKALQEIKNMGVTHVWYTGILHHALVSDYKSIGISDDNPYVVKGKAGSPYAIKDYYNVNPDLATNPQKRLWEFEQLIERTHRNGLKVIIDIVPNHVARKYESISAPKGVRDFGQDDDTSVEFRTDNNFYYVPNEALQLPQYPTDYHPISQGMNVAQYQEYPAKWTGNDVRNSHPEFNDWYETAKLNFGISQQGIKNFAELPQGYEYESYQLHYDFWQEQKVPNTWEKFCDIALYWIEKGVDGFRYDMAQMVPVEFWSYLNSAIKMKKPETFLLAEIYTPEIYRSYLYMGKMDALYNKVQLYDTLRNIIQHRHSTDRITQIQNELQDISHRMVHFLENHDEQRIASEEFATDPSRALPAMVVLHTISQACTMIYFGQEVGEPALEKAGFGSPSRTSIFDYVGVPQHQKWMNNGAFDGGQLSDKQKYIRSYYQKLLNINLQGSFCDIHLHNRAFTEFYNDKVYAFVRGDKHLKKHIVVVNFDPYDTFGFELQIPQNVIERWQLPQKKYTITDILTHNRTAFEVRNNIGRMRIDIKPLESFIFEIE